MIDRETVWPLVAGAGVALGLHGLLLPWAVLGLEQGSGRAARPPKVDRTLPAVEQVELGHDRLPTATVAWIDYEDFQELMARRSRTEQPALQQQVDPVEHAPLEPDPTPPAPPAPEPVAVVPPGAEVAREAPSAVPLAVPPPPPAIDLPAPDPAGRIAFAPPAPPSEAAQAEPRPADAPPDQPSDPPTDQPPDQPPDQPTDQPPGQPARPTAAPRAESEAAPTQLSDERFEVQPGGVITGPGIRIRVARPEISIVARSSTLPHNAQATLTFDVDGRVIDVALTRSTGAANYDGPIIASLYKWRAAGERVDAMDRPFEVKVTLILVEGEE